MFCLSGVLYFPNVQRGKKQYESLLSGDALYLWKRCSCDPSHFMDCRNYRDTLSRFVLLCYANYWLYDISKMYKKRIIINERGYVTG